MKSADADPFHWIRRKANTLAHAALIASVATIANVAFATGGAAQEAKQIRFARQTSIAYPQLYIIEEHNLIQKHAELLGVGEVEDSWITFNGPNAVNDALISGNVDVGVGGVPGLLILWDKTQDTPREVKGIAAFGSGALLLNSRRPEVQSIADLTDEDRIALAAVKVSVQAILLQMAAAKEFGQENFEQLDPLTVSMAPSDGTIALISNAAGVTASFATPPFQEQQLKTEGIHTILNSFEATDGPHSITVAWTTSIFRDENPDLYKVLVAAMQEATDIVNQDKGAAAQLWVTKNNSTMSAEDATEILAGDNYRWTMAPEGTKKIADFMHEVGTLDDAPDSWKDLFFPEIHDLPGS